METNNNPVLLGRIDGKLDMVLRRMDGQDEDIKSLRASLKEDLQSFRSELSDIKEKADERLRQLENFRTRVVTYASMCSAIIITLYELGRDYILK